MVNKNSNNIAWFLNEDGRAPQTLYIMYNDEKNEPFYNIHFMMGEIRNVSTLFFDVEDTKWAKPEHILKWDFLPNSTGIPLANERALELLEEVAPEQIQAIPTEIKLPNGTLIRNYKLINITRTVTAIDYNKCILKEERFRTKTNKYKDYRYNRICLPEGIHLAREKDRISIAFGSENLRKAVKKAKLTGLTFKESYGGIHRFIEE